MDVIDEHRRLHADLCDELRQADQRIASLEQRLREAMAELVREKAARAAAEARLEGGR